MVAKALTNGQRVAGVQQYNGDAAFDTSHAPSREAGHDVCVRDATRIPCAGEHEAGAC
jgi:hypothetical protein